MDKSILTTAMVSSTATIIAITISVLGFADARYAKAEDLEGFKDQFSDLRRASIEDSLFDLESIKPSERTPTDLAKIERFKRELQDLKDGH